MPRPMKFMIAGSILFLLLVGGFLAYLGWELRTQPPTSELPALVRNLPRQVVDIEPEFQRRVRAQFPDGIATAALRDDLRQKGFRVREDRASGLAIAVLEQHTAICAKFWIVSWHPDLQGRARNIGAHFNLGCL
jgi:hypothetical protein